MHINMKKKSLFKRVSGVLTGVFFSTSFILAANENGQLFGSETLIREKGADFVIELKANQRSLRYGLEDSIKATTPTRA